jgi:hypothetical protein
VETPLNPEVCATSGYIMLKGKCYSPTLPLKRRPNSSAAPEK